MRAAEPTMRSPSSVYATTDGVVRLPSEFTMTVGSSFSRTHMHELVVPRSIPIILDMLKLSYLLLSHRRLAATVK